MPLFNPQVSNKLNFVFEGDSLSDPSAIENPNESYPYQLMKLASPFLRVNPVYIAKAGDTIQNAIDDFPTQALPYSPNVTGIGAYYFIWIGTNDIATGISAATSFAKLQTLWALARNAGFKVVAFTVTDRTDNTSDENAQLALLNGYIRDAGSEYDFLVDVNYFIGYNGTTVDGIHFNAAADKRIANYIWACLHGAGDPLITCNFRAFSGAALWNSGSATTVVFGAESYDDRSAYDPTTGIFTAPVTGIYDFSFFLVGSLTLTATQFFAVDLFDSSNTELAKINYTTGLTATAQNWGCGGAASILLNKGDTAKIGVFTDGSFQGYNGSPNTWFCGSLRKKI